MTSTDRSPAPHVPGPPHGATQTVARRQRNAQATATAWLAWLAHCHQGTQLGRALGRDVSVFERVGADS